MDSPWARLRQGDAPSPGLLGALTAALPGVDAVGAAGRCATLWSRSIKAGSQALALDLALSMVDLTTLEGADTADRVRALAAKATRPDPDDASCPAAAAVCVYPDLAGVAALALAGTGVAVAAVATAFPAGRSSLEVKLADTALAVTAGADEIDMVIDRGALLSGRLDAVFAEIRAVKAACGRAHLKVILETCELGSLDVVRQASWLAMAAGADVIKTSTGKAAAGATPVTALVMCQAVRDFARLSDEVVGVKVAGGIRSAKDALRYLVLVNETAGSEWLCPELFRFGASSLLNDLVAQRRHLRSGVYPGPEYLAVG